MQKMIKIYTWTGGYLVLDLEENFPMAQLKLNAIYQKIIKGCRREEEVLDHLIRYVDDRITEMELEFSTYEMPELEKSRSTRYKRLLSNLKALQGYRRRCR